MQLVKSSGKLMFDPIPKTGKIEKLFTPHVAMVSLDDEVDKYYRWFLEKEKGLILQASAWGPHITFLKDEPISNELWEKVKLKYNNTKIEFEHEVFIKSNSKYWWLKVYCPKLFEIRNELGLDLNYKFSFHITLGMPIPRHIEHSQYIYRLEYL